jgi:hypothetical protein
MDTYVLIVLGAIVGLLGAVVLFIAWKMGYTSGYNSANGMKGQDARRNRQTQVNLAMLRIKELHDAKTPPLDIAKQVIVEYPDVAFQALREAQKMAKEMGISID